MTLGGSPKLPREVLEPFATSVMTALRLYCFDVVLCGSMRRMSDKCSDIDIVVTGAPDNIRSVIESAVDRPVEIEQEGMNVRSCYVFRPLTGPREVRIDIWKTIPDRLGAATLYATGPGLANVGMRRWARHLGFELTFDGVYDVDLLVASRTEEDCLEILGIPWISPEERTDYESWIGPFLDIMNSEENDA